MIRYPESALRTIGVTAPSSGVPQEHHHLLQQAKERLEKQGFLVQTGETAWTQTEAKSAPAEQRAAELMRMLKDPEIDLILPPWGGELLVETLEFLDFADLEPKWVLGYSDVSLLLLAITLNTGIATAHGTNLIDLRGEASDSTTGRWLDVLRTNPGGSVEQESSVKYQLEWSHEAPSPVVFHLTEPTEWKTVSGEGERFEGRLLGGCIDVIRHVIGTPYGDIAKFREEHIPEEPVVWYLENCEMNVADLKRSLTQMKYAGWFSHISGIVFGRSPANQEVGGYTIEKMYADLSDELGVPIAYDIDLGHMPPQITFINGAYATIDVENGKGTVKQEFR
ncbi:S66 family peptidase [Planococcus sp. FY231025]|uniref:S66 family peptidase n=1 Tax=Planococcus sp. FY231025 TaxID=3455699 RepID=UPI003F8DDAB5